MNLYSAFCKKPQTRLYISVADIIKLYIRWLLWTESMADAFLHNHVLGFSGMPSVVGLLEALFQGDKGHAPSPLSSAVKRHSIIYFSESTNEIVVITCK